MSWSLRVDTQTCSIYKKGVDMSLCRSPELQAEVASLISATLVTYNFTAPLEEAHAVLNKLLLDDFVPSSAAGFWAAAFSNNVRVAQTSSNSWRAFRCVPDAIVWWLYKVDEVSFIKWSTFTFVGMVVSKFSIGVHLTAFLVKVKQAFSYDRKCIKL